MLLFYPPPISVYIFLTQSPRANLKLIILKVHIMNTNCYVTVVKIVAWSHQYSLQSGQKNPKVYNYFSIMV